jgi:hypothetical protein
MVRLGPYDPRLLRPALVPTLARVAKKFMKDESRRDGEGGRRNFA